MLTSLLVAIGCAVLLTLAGGLLTTIGPWYRDLRKPSWQPPNWAFGPAWTIILGLAAWSAAEGWTASPTGAAKAVVVGLFAANALFHFLWSPLFFRWRRPDWALIEVGFLWLSIAVLILWLAPFSERAAWLLAPYLAWVTFASLLNRAIVRLNGPFAA